MTPRAAASGGGRPATAPRGCTSLKLRQLSRRVSRHYESHLSEAGLRTTQFSLLSHIGRLGPLRLGALAEALGLQASTLTRNLQPLLDQGWVQVQVGDDARSREVVATAAGVALREQAQHAWRRAQGALNERLGVQRVAALHELLDECMGLLAEGEPGDD